MKKILLPIAMAALSLTAGCGGRHTPVARVAVEPRQVSLPFGQVRTLQLTWTPSAPLEGETPTVFVHLLDRDRKVVRTFDHPFPQRWREGAPISYGIKLYQSVLAPPLPVGTYRLTLGLYGKDNRRWALDGLGEPEAGRDEYDAATVDVPAGNPSPRFAFSASWQPIEPGSDRQVLARRWMAKRAAVRLVGQKGPGSVWMIFQIPPVNLPDAKLTLDPGATAPSVLAVGNCGGTETSLTGPGVHEVEMAMDAPPPDGFCRISLTSNFLLEPTTAVARGRSVSLENIAWIPDDGGRARPRAGAGAREATTPTSPE